MTHVRLAEAGTVHYLTLEEIRNAISEIGYQPRQRNVHYQLLDEEHEQQAVEASRTWVNQRRIEQQELVQIETDSNATPATAT